MKAATLSIYGHLFSSIAEDMGVTLERSAYSPNIKERLDFSCAIFLGDSQMLAQAAHIPVHLGAMPDSVKAAIRRCAPFEPGDVVIVNDPYLGGTHLPDITIISPAFVKEQRSEPAFFVASRAHHSDIGGLSPGSMPLSTEIYQEGLIIPPVKLFNAGQRNDALWELILNNVRTPQERAGDLAAQLAANDIGLGRLYNLISRNGLRECLTQAQDLIEYATKMTRAAIDQIPDGRYTFKDYLDDDGRSTKMIPLQVTITINGEKMMVDFTGSAQAVPGNLNAVPSIVESAVVYCLRCVAMQLLETELPMNQGAFEPLSILTEPGSILNPPRPYAVAAGNVETSQRVVYVVFGALSKALPHLIPAASQGTMNNLTFGSRLESVDNPFQNNLPESAKTTPGQPADGLFAYYETIGGGTGAGPMNDGGHSMHAHMSNTLNTPVEALEYGYPVRVIEYRQRSASGGAGKFKGGDGLVRTLEFLVPVTATVVSERRSRPPYGLNGGLAGKTGLNHVIRKGRVDILPGKFTVDLDAGDRLQIETPGGGGWGSPVS